MVDREHIFAESRVDRDGDRNDHQKIGQIWGRLEIALVAEPLGTHHVRFARALRREFRAAFFLGIGGAVESRGIGIGPEGREQIRGGSELFVVHDPERKRAVVLRLELFSMPRT